MTAERQHICPKCRAFLPRKLVKCPYCQRAVIPPKDPKKRCRLCGGLEFKVMTVGDVLPGQKKIQKFTVCANCGKQV